MIEIFKIYQKFILIKRIIDICFFVDTESLYSMAYNCVTQEYGKTYSWELKAKIMGFKGSEALQTIIDMLQLPITVQTFEDKLAPIYQEVFPKCDLMPGKSRKMKII